MCSMTFSKDDLNPMFTKCRGNMWKLQLDSNTSRYKEKYLDQASTNQTNPSEIYIPIQKQKTKYIEKIRTKLKSQTYHFTKKPQVKQCNRSAALDERTGWKTGKCQHRLPNSRLLALQSRFKPMHLSLRRSYKIRHAAFLHIPSAFEKALELHRTYIIPETKFPHNLTQIVLIITDL